MTVDADDLVADCLRARAEGGRSAITEVIEQAARAGGSTSVTRRTWSCTAPDLLIQRFLWPPGYRVEAHDHGGVWAVVGVYGGEEESRWYRKIETGAVEAAGTRTYAAGHVASMGPEAVHGIRNPRTREWTAALHVYGGDFNQPPHPRSRWPEPALEPAAFDAAANVAEFVAAVREARTRGFVRNSR